MPLQVCFGLFVWLCAHAVNVWEAKKRTVKVSLLCHYIDLLTWDVTAYGDQSTAWKSQCIPTCGFQESNSGPQAWLRASSPPEPCCWPSQLVLGVWLGRQ